jgi:hypothetical protein
MKTCAKCGDEKSDDEFSFKNKKKGTRQSACKDCYSGIMKSHYEDNKQTYFARNKIAAERRTHLLRDLKEKTPCTDCCKSYPHYIMEFDHKENKLFAVGDARTWKQLMSEMAKCDIVCSNCHAERTWKRKMAL